MCTCGIDIATQQATPAMHSSDLQRCRRERHSGLPARAAGVPAPAPCSAGGRRRSISASGSIVTTQNTPMPMWVARQPKPAMKCCTTGGQKAPAR